MSERTVFAKSNQYQNITNVTLIPNLVVEDKGREIERRHIRKQRESRKGRR